jgi:hypothetical protein
VCIAATVTFRLASTRHAKSSRASCRQSKLQARHYLLSVSFEVLQHVHNELKQLRLACCNFLKLISGQHRCWSAVLPLEITSISCFASTLNESHMRGRKDEVNKYQVTNEDPPTAKMSVDMSKCTHLHTLYHLCACLRSCAFMCHLYSVHLDVTSIYCVYGKRHHKRNFAAT